MTDENINPDLEPKEDFSIPSRSVGEILKEAREKKNVSIKIISKHTKISSTMLEFLENNQFDLLPNKAYVIGYVKSYAKALDIDVSECLKALDEDYKRWKGENNELDIEDALPKEIAPLEVSSPDLWIKVASIAFIVIVIISFIMLRSDNENPSTQVAQKTAKKVEPQILTQNTPLKSKDFNETEKTQDSPEEGESSEAENNNDQDIDEEAEQVSEENQEEKNEEEKEEKTVNFRKFTGQLYTVNEEVDPIEQELIPESIREQYIEGQQNIYLKSKEDSETWFTYKVDDNDIGQNVLRNGGEIFLSGNTILLFIGNISAVDIFLNNQVLNVESRTGVKSLIFPKEEKDNFHLPLFIFDESGKAETAKEYAERKEIELP